MDTIVILDTGDNYIISQKSLFNIVKNIYSMIDISINEIETNITITQDKLEYIYMMIGRIISYGFSDTDANTRIDIPGKLKEDIVKVLEFMKVKSFWENMQFPPKPKKNYTISLLDLVDTSRWGASKWGDKPFGPEDKIDTPPNNYKKDPEVYVLFNTIYNISLVVSDEDINNDINVFTSAFKEFVLIDKFTIDNTENIYKHFHKVSFNLSEITKKMQAFKELFSYQDSNNEKNKVKQFLEYTYTLSTDIDKKIKANDLYKELINNLCIPYEESALFKKRLAGYLIEFNLQKKRFSDAYYYYGLIRKESVKVSLEDLEEKRKLESKTYKYCTESLTNMQSLSKISSLESSMQATLKQLKNI